MTPLHRGLQIKAEARRLSRRKKFGPEALHLVIVGGIDTAIAKDVGAYLQLARIRRSPINTVYRTIHARNWSVKKQARLARAALKTFESAEATRDATKAPTNREVLTTAAKSKSPAPLPMANSKGTLMPAPMPGNPKKPQRMFEIENGRFVVIK